MYTIEDLRNGKCAVRNDGTQEELREVLEEAFAPYKGMSGAFLYYTQHPNKNSIWDGTDNTMLPIQSVKDFLKPKSEYPKLMWVSRNSNMIDKIPRVVFMEKNGKYIAWSNANTLEKSEKTCATSTWPYAKDIEEPQIVELTFKDISEGKGVGVDPSLIRIKE